MVRETIRNRLARAWPAISKKVLSPSAQIEGGESVARLALQTAPVVWLLGKVQTGKSSIVRALTGVDKVEIGQGFAACTQRSSVYDFPEDAPLVRFLDTRGLGEVDYDAGEDMAWCEDRAHLLLVVMRASDGEQEAVLEAIGEIRRRHPDWPVIVAQTCLHMLYPPGAEHVLPYPFAQPDASADVPSDLARALASQRSLFNDIGGGAIDFVPLDFTPPEEGYEPSEYGLAELERAIQRAVPLSLIAAKRETVGAWRDAFARSAHPHILGFASAAGVADVVPAVGIVAVPAIQAKLLHSLASIYGVPWNRQRLAEFAGALGVGVGTRYTAGFLARQLGKFIPVYGQTVAATLAAATSFATTFALGKAAGAYLAQRHVGRAFDAYEISEAYAKALEDAFAIAKRRSCRRPVPPNGKGAREDQIARK